jgi:hypothetical protein
MTKNVAKPSKDDLYNKKRIPLLRVEIVPTDDAVLLQKIKADFIAKSGNPKQAIIDLHAFADKVGYFDTESDDETTNQKKS